MNAVESGKPARLPDTLTGLAGLLLCHFVLSWFFVATPQPPLVVEQIAGVGLATAQVLFLPLALLGSRIRTSTYVRLRFALTTATWIFAPAFFGVLLQRFR